MCSCTAPVSAAAPSGKSRSAARRAARGAAVEGGEVAAVEGAPRPRGAEGGVEGGALLAALWAAKSLQPG